jgi:hypothetical protein
MKKLEIVKQSLTAIHTKMIVLPNDCCAPFISGVQSHRYIVAPKGWSPGMPLVANVSQIISHKEDMGPIQSLEAEERPEQKPEPDDIAPIAKEKRRPTQMDYCIYNMDAPFTPVKYTADEARRYAEGLAIARADDAAIAADAVSP